MEHIICTQSFYAYVHHPGITHGLHRPPRYQCPVGIPGCPTRYSSRYPSAPALRQRCLHVRGTNLKAFFSHKNGDDIRDLEKWCAVHRTPITARAAGTSLAGQNYRRRRLSWTLPGTCRVFLEIRPAEGRATVQPGVIRDTLNREAAVHRPAVWSGYLHHQPLYARRHDWATTLPDPSP